jgi:hypothetical protein
VRYAVAAAVITAVGASLAAQNPLAEPRFDAVSVKRNKSGENTGPYLRYEGLHLVVSITICSPSCGVPGASSRPNPWWTGMGEIGARAIRHQRHSPQWNPSAADAGHGEGAPGRPLQADNPFRDQKFTDLCAGPGAT